MNILVSACLLGINCRYDGSGFLNSELKTLLDSHCVIPICPEIYGGLSTPRPQAEISNGKVLSISGEDVTDKFYKGAEETLKLAKLFGCKLAILKERSPSCGCGTIYDGSFSGTLVSGNGITAELLMRNGIKVIGESAAAAYL